MAEHTDTFTEDHLDDCARLFMIAFNAEPWNDKYTPDTANVDWNDPLRGFRPRSLRREGLAAAKDLKLFLGELIYLEFRPFQEIVISWRDSTEEAPVPAFILALSEDK